MLKIQDELHTTLKPRNYECFVNIVSKVLPLTNPLA